MGDVVELLSFIWTNYWSFFLGLTVLWGCMGLIALAGRWLEGRDLRRWTSEDGQGEKDDGVSPYARALLGGHLQPEQVEGVTKGSISAGDAKILWSGDGIDVVVDGERHSLAEERFARIQLSRTTDPALPHWWWGEDPPREWLSVAIRFGEHEVKVKAAMPAGWDELALPELRSSGQTLPLKDLLSFLEAAAFHEVDIAEHRLSAGQAEPVSVRNENPAARHASWLYPFAPIAVLYPFWFLATVVHEEFSHRGETLLDMPELLFVLVPLLGGVGMGVAAFRYTRRLVRGGVWPDAAGPRKRKYNHHLWYSVALTLLWIPVAAIPAAVGSLYRDAYVLPVLGITVGLGIWVSHRILKSRRYVHGPAEPHRKGPHVALEYGAGEERGG